MNPEQKAAVQALKTQGQLHRVFGEMGNAQEIDAILALITELEADKKALKERLDSLIEAGHNPIHAALDAAMKGAA